LTTLFKSEDVRDRPAQLQNNFLGIFTLPTLTDKYGTHTLFIKSVGGFASSR